MLLLLVVIPTARGHEHAGEPLAINADVLPGHLGEVLPSGDRKFSTNLSLPKENERLPSMSMKVMTAVISGVWGEGLWDGEGEDRAELESENQGEVLQEMAAAIPADP